MSLSHSSLSVLTFDLFYLPSISNQVVYDPFGHHILNDHPSGTANYKSSRVFYYTAIK